VLRALTGAAVASALPAAPVHWHASTAVGDPWHGRLARGVQLPAEGRHFFTWDPILKRSPDRAWRRWGTDRLVRLTLRVASEYAAAHPRAPRLGIGDLSRPHGGDFGIRYGWPGHVSHQNGRDVDVYYPRRDGRERAPTRVGQIDHALAQDLVERFVRAGAVLVFVGPHTGLTGPRGVVYRLVHHDNHVHVRIGPVRSARDRGGRAASRGDGLARSQRVGKPARAHERGARPVRVLPF
jgi:murein endopeptidase